MKFEQIIDCPICLNGKAELKVDQTSALYKGENFLINEHYYKCTACGEEFSGEGMMDFNLAQVYDQYFKKYPEQVGQ